MTTTDRQLPVFVYGTLRSGQGNYRGILAGHTTSERPALLRGYKLLNSGVPFAVPGEGLQVIGEAMDVRTSEWDEVLYRLDCLEGYTGRDHDSLYVRAVRQVELADGGEIDAYVYLASQSTLRGHWLTNAPEVPGGDWLAADAA
ncbi:gamma-glutamylcyclotransferase family protein [Kitasatospora sp. NPDC001540]|uniref:gamma-glutamylcyclotransferase family protein n=1 Tax=Kitasatospora sp. NPDC001540 TaxID=3364014 RepID=UPI003678764F